MAYTTCPGCGLDRPAQDTPPTDRYNASAECWHLFTELTGETMARTDPEFAHQHCVDAYGAQHAGGPTKPITTAFALIGLHLAIDEDYTGREIQQVHMELGEADREWPQFTPPEQPGEYTVQTVLEASPGPERDTRITDWAESVWAAWDHAHERVKRLCRGADSIDGA
jgi:hypothetical protein